MNIFSLFTLCEMCIRDRMKAVQPDSDTATIEVEDEETLATNEMTVYYDAVPDDADEETTVGMSYLDAVSYLEENGFDEPDPADYGVWIPGIPVLVGDALDAAGAADWLSGLINDGIVAGVGAVLGFVPQMLVPVSYTHLDAYKRQPHIPGK